MASGLEPDPNPGMDDQRFSRFCCLLASAVVAVASLMGASLIPPIVVGEGADADAVIDVVFCVLADLLVLADDPVVLGDW